MFHYICKTGAEGGGYKTYCKNKTRQVKTILHSNHVDKIEAEAMVWSNKAENTEAGATVH